MQIMKKNRTTVLAIVPTNGILEHILARQLSAHRERLHPSGRACSSCRRAAVHLARPAAGVGGGMRDRDLMDSSLSPKRGVGLFFCHRSSKSASSLLLETHCVHSFNAGRIRLPLVHPEGGGQEGEAQKYVHQLDLHFPVPHPVQALTARPACPSRPVTDSSGGLRCCCGQTAHFIPGFKSCLTG